MQLFLSVLFCKDCSYWVLNFARWLFSSIGGWLGRRLAAYVVLKGKISMAGPL